MAKVEPRRIFAELERPSMPKALEKALSNVFFGEFKETIKVSKNASYFFVEEYRTEMAPKEPLIHILEHIFEIWKQHF